MLLSMKLAADDQFMTIVKSALSKTSTIELTEAELNVLRLCRLLVDIQYRKHEQKLEQSADEGVY